MEGIEQCELTWQVVVAGKSQVVLGEEEEYDWSVGNKLAELYEVDLGDEILGWVVG